MKVWCTGLTHLDLSDSPGSSKNRVFKKLYIPCTSGIVNL